MNTPSKEVLLDRIAACDSMLRNVLKGPQIPYQQELSEKFAQPVREERDALIAQLEKENSEVEGM